MQPQLSNDERQLRAARCVGHSLFVTWRVLASLSCPHSGCACTATSPRARNDVRLSTGFRRQRMRVQTAAAASDFDPESSPTFAQVCSCCLSPTWAAPNPYRQCAGLCLIFSNDTCGLLSCEASRWPLAAVHEPNRLSRWLFTLHLCGGVLPLYAKPTELAWLQVPQQSSRSARTVCTAALEVADYTVRVP